MAECLFEDPYSLVERSVETWVLDEDHSALARSPMIRRDKVQKMLPMVIVWLEFICDNFEEGEVVEFRPA